MRFEDAFGLWQEGQRRLAASEPQDRHTLERVVDAVVDELRRRLGGPFTTAELTRLYDEQGTDWAFAIATRVAPGNPAAWEMPVITGAAFARYAHEASDFRDRLAAREEEEEQEAER